MLGKMLKEGEQGQLLIGLGWGENQGRSRGSLQVHETKVGIRSLDHPLVPVDLGPPQSRRGLAPSITIRESFVQIRDAQTSLGFFLDRLMNNSQRKHI